MMDIAMPKPVHITTPYPTSEEVARRFRIPKRRQKELEALAQKLFAQMQAEKTSARGRVLEKEEDRKNASAAY
jgi:hypothetical protein